MKRRILILAGVLAAALSSTAGYAQTIKMGYTAMDLTNPYFIEIANGMRDRAAELGIELTVNDAKNDAAAQVSAVENFIVQKMAAIIVSPIDGKAIEPLVERIHAAGSVLINANQPIEGADAFLTVPEKDYGLAIGRMAGKYIADKMGGEATVALLTLPEVAAVIARGDGIREGILEMAPQAKIVAEQSAAAPDTGARAAETIMQAQPNVNVFVGVNDGGILGAYEAISAKGVDQAAFALFGADATKEALKRIREGSMYKGTVDIDPYGSGKLIIDTALKVIKSGAIAETIQFPMNPVTAETATQ